MFAQGLDAKRGLTIALTTLAFALVKITIATENPVIEFMAITQPDIKLALMIKIGVTAQVEEQQTVQILRQRHKHIRLSQRPIITHPAQEFDIGTPFAFFRRNYPFDL